MIKAFIFDLDDTLYDEIEFVRGGFKKVSRYLSESSGVDEDILFRSLSRILKDHGRGQIFNILLKELNLYDKALVEKLIEIYRTHDPDLSLYPDAERVLVDLKKQAYRLGLITDGNVYVQRRKVRSLGIARFFDCMIFSDEYGIENQKPSPLPYEKAIKALAAAPEELVYVGDNPHKDFITAKRIGMHTARIMRGSYRDVAPAQEYEAEYQIESLADIFCLKLLKIKGKNNE